MPLKTDTERIIEASPLEARGSRKGNEEREIEKTQTTGEKKDALRRLF